jgi:hypothetical protein
MAIVFRCTGCRHPFNVHDHLAGKRIKCATCGTSLVVPAESAQSAPVAEVPEGPPPRRRAVMPIAAAAPAPPRPPVGAPPVQRSAEPGGDELSAVAASVGTHSIHIRRRRGMPLVGWGVMLVGFGACVVLAVIVLKNDGWRGGGNRAANNRAIHAAESSLDAGSSTHDKTKAADKSDLMQPAGDGVDERSIANSPAETAPPPATRQNSLVRGEAALQAAKARSDGEGKSHEPADQVESAKSQKNDASDEIQPNQRVVVRRITRFRDESDKESFVHDRTEGRFLKFEEGMAHVALEIRIGDEVTGRVPAQDLDFGRSVELDDVNAIAALKKAGAKLASNRVGYIERLECPFRMTDDLLEFAARLPRLVAINANFSGVSDAGLAHLKSHNRLKELLLSQTSITDAGLEHLATISTLEKLDLEETKITDLGLSHLVALEKLKQVALRKTGVTDTGVAELKKNRSLRSVKF